MLTRSRVVITGIGILAPNGVGKKAFWQSLLNRESGIGPITLFDASDLPCRIGGEVTGFDPEDYIDARLKPQRRMGRSSQMAVAGTRMALDDAGLTLDDLRSFGEVPVVIGVSTSAMDLFANPPNLWTASASIPHAAGSAISYTLGIPARLHTISDGCASGLDALAAAAHQIAQGQTDIAIAGSSDSAMTHYVFQGFAKSKRLSLRNDEPEKASRPFDRDRDGGVISEGAGIVVLENLEHALARGVDAYAEITGFGTCADPPESMVAAGLRSAMERAIANAGRRVEDVDHVSAHAPSDEHMDAAETQLIREVFGKHAYRLTVTSIKGATGNAMAVGGLHQAIATAMAIRERTVPPTTNLDHPDPECDLDYVPEGPRLADIQCALVNTHGFGRGNSALILERVDETALRAI